MFFRLVDDKRKLIPQVWFLSNLRFLGHEIEAGDCKTMKTEQFMVTVSEKISRTKKKHLLPLQRVCKCLLKPFSCWLWTWKLRSWVGLKIWELIVLLIIIFCLKSMNSSRGSAGICSPLNLNIRVCLWSSAGSSVPRSVQSLTDLLSGTQN